MKSAPSRVDEVRRALEIIHNLGAVHGADADWPRAMMTAVVLSNCEEGSDNSRCDLILEAFSILVNFTLGESLTIPEMTRRVAMPAPLSLADVAKVTESEPLIVSDEAREFEVEDALGTLLGAQGMRGEHVTRVNWAEIVVGAVAAVCAGSRVGLAEARAEEVEHAIGTMIGLGTEELTIPEALERLVNGRAIGGRPLSQVTEELADRAAPLVPDARYQFSGAELKALLGEVAGAASGVFLRESPDKEMPSTEMAEAVQGFLIESAPTFSRAYVQGPS